MRTFCKVVLLVFLAYSVRAQDQHKIDSLQNLLKTDIADTTRVNTLNVLGWAFKYSDPDTSIVLCNQALELAVKNENKKGQAKAFLHLGVVNWLKSNYPIALGNYHKALKINEALNDKKGISATIGNIGIVHYSQGDYPKALEYYFKTLKMCEELGSKNHVGAWLGNIGIVYYEQGDYPNALEYYFKALKMGEEMGDKNRVAIQLSSIGNVYNAKGDLSSKALPAGKQTLEQEDNHEKALEYYFKALKMREELGGKNYITTILGNMGVVYRKQGDYVNALEYYFKALKIAEEIGSKNYIASILGNIGSLYTIQAKNLPTQKLQQAKYAEAEKYLLMALEICKEISALNEERQFEESISNLYAEAGQYQKAYEHYKAYSIAKDSLFNEQKSKDIGKLEAKHEFETAEAERKRVEEEQTKQETAEKSRRDNLQYSGILIFLVLVFAGVFALGKVSIPIRLAEGLIFFSFLLFFEFTLVLLDPYIEQYSSGAPAIKLAFNAVLAGLIFPLHSLFETKLKKRLAR